MTYLFRVHLLEGESIEFKEFGLRDNVAQLFVFEVPMYILTTPVIACSVWSCFCVSYFP